MTVMRSKDLRRAAAGLALALAVAAAVPAAAEPPAWSGGWIEAFAGRLGGWWAAALGGETAGPPSASAASEASPNLDPDGVQQQPDGYSGSQGLAAEPTDEGDAAPNLDPDG